MHLMKTPQRGKIKKKYDIMYKFTAFSDMYTRKNGNRKDYFMWKIFKFWSDVLIQSKFTWKHQHIFSTFLISVQCLEATTGDVL